MTKKILPYFILLSLLLLTGGHLSAQQNDVLILKNGSMIEGSILLNETDNTVTVKNKCGIWVYPISDIDSVSYNTGGNRITNNRRGFYLLPSVAVLLGKDVLNTQDMVGSLNVAAGFKYNRHLFIGTGTGYEYYDWAVLPVFGHIQYNIRQDVVVPYISVKVGYAFPLVQTVQEESPGGADFFQVMNAVIQSYDTQGGLHFNPELGIMYPLGKRTALQFGIGYHYQQLSYQYTNPYNADTQMRKIHEYNRVSVRLALMFM